MSNQGYIEAPFRQFMTLLRRQWKLIAAFSLAGLIVAALIAIMVSPRYTAKTQLLVSLSDADPMNRLDEAIVDTHVALLTSPSHLRRVLESLAAESRAGLPQSGTAPVPDPNAVDALPPEVQETMDFETLQQGLNVYKERSSRVISVAFTSTDPQQAATMANRVANLYVQMGIERAEVRHDEAETLLEKRIPAARAELENAEAAVREYRLASGLVDIGRLELMDLKIAELTQQLEKNSSELSEYDSHIDRLTNLGQHEDGLPLIAEALQDPWLAKFRRVQTFAADGMAGGNDAGSPPSGAPASGQVDRTAQEQVSKMAAEMVAQLTRDRGAIEARGLEILQHLEALARSRQETREPEQQLRELERKAAAAAQLYESLLQRRTELAVQGAVPADTRMASAASIPEMPSSPAPILFLLPALVAAGIAAGFVSIVVEHLDHRLRSEQDIERELGVNSIGLVPKLSGPRGRVPLTNLINSPFDPYTECIRSVVTAAMMQLSQEPMVFLVTSSRRGEGKTTLAISFAVYAALLRRRVLLIDLNFQNPGLSRALDGPEDLGIADVLNGRSPNDAIKSVADLGIDYLPLSHKGGYPLAMLSTDRLPNMLDDLKRQYDCIVIDSAPLLGTTEARLFASLADKVIFAVKWGDIDQDVARGALHQLRRAGIDNVAEFVSAVVTQVDMRKHVFGRYGAAVDIATPPRDLRLPRIPRIPIRDRPSLQSPAA
jgi:uncharacterized protein involved in exopolysaccharide biosynthesis/cellulose biosynthesis protein BcsQ